MHRVLTYRDVHPAHRAEDHHYVDGTNHPTSKDTALPLRKPVPCELVPRLVAVLMRMRLKGERKRLGFSGDRRIRDRYPPAGASPTGSARRSGLAIGGLHLGRQRVQVACDRGMGQHLEAFDQIGVLLHLARVDHHPDWHVTAQ